MIDLHTHSRVSDGSEPPARVVELAAEAGCSALALTDHDTLAGLAEATEASERLGVRLVRGCEVSCRKPRLSDGTRAAGSMHVLCYFVEGIDGELQDELELLRSDRLERNLRLVTRLRELGVDITWDEVVAEAGTEAGVGRPHFARVLVRTGTAADIDDAFDRFLADGRPAYVPKGRLDGADVVHLARESGAVAVLAHPLSLGFDAARLDHVVGELAEAGLGGLEAIYGAYDRGERRSLCRMAERHGVVGTGGSDFHGRFKTGLFVGSGRGDLEVPDSVLDELEAKRPSG